MDAVIENPARQPKQEVNRLTRVSDLDDNVRSQIEQALEQAGVPADPAQGLGPATSEPVLSPQTATLVRATNVGNEPNLLQEEVESKHRDLRQYLKGLTGWFRGGHTEKRVGPVGRIWNRIRNLRIRNRTNLKDKTDFSQDLE